ncbi:hypothetical protein TNCV_2324971 [Trichonephila clavipes]|nr:hypothetical protein TNCV_2324971 [Trichonephila clavipes]
MGALISKAIGQSGIEYAHEKKALEITQGEQTKGNNGTSWNQHRRVRTNLHIIRNNNLTAQRYANEILSPQVLPNIASIGDSFLLMQDNASNHTACLEENFLKAETIKHMKCPAYYLDLNLIHHAWDSFERRIQ